MSELFFLTLNIRLGAAQGLVGVADISLLTAADGLVVDHLTLGCRSTGSGTRVETLLSGTGQVAGTITVENTLRSAVRWLSEISRQAGTGCETSLVPALREWSTGVWQAGVLTFSAVSLLSLEKLPITVRASIKWCGLVTSPDPSL